MSSAPRQPKDSKVSIPIYATMPRQGRGNSTTTTIKMNTITISFAERYRCIARPASYTDLQKQGRKAFPMMGSVASLVVLFRNPSLLPGRWVELSPDAYAAVQDGEVLYFNVQQPVTKEYILPLPDQEDHLLIPPTARVARWHEMVSRLEDSRPPPPPVPRTTMTTATMTTTTTSAFAAPPPNASADDGDVCGSGWGVASERFRRSARLVPDRKECREAIGLTEGESNGYPDEQQTAPGDDAEGENAPEQDLQGQRCDDDAPGLMCPGDCDCLSCQRGHQAGVPLTQAYNTGTILMSLGGSGGGDGGGHGEYSRADVYWHAPASAPRSSVYSWKRQDDTPNVHQPQSNAGNSWGANAKQASRPHNSTLDCPIYYNTQSPPPEPPAQYTACARYTNQGVSMAEGLGGTAGGQDYYQAQEQSKYNAWPPVAREQLIPGAIASSPETLPQHPTNDAAATMTMAPCAELSSSSWGDTPCPPPRSSGQHFNPAKSKTGLPLNKSRAVARVPSEWAASRSAAITNRRRRTAAENWGAPPRQRHDFCPDDADAASHFREDGDGDHVVSADFPGRTPSGPDKVTTTATKELSAWGNTWGNGWGTENAADAVHDGDKKKKTKNEKASADMVPRGKQNSRNDDSDGINSTAWGSRKQKQPTPVLIETRRCTFVYQRPCSLCASRRCCAHRNGGNSEVYDVWGGQIACDWGDKCLAINLDTSTGNEDNTGNQRWPHFDW